MLNDRPLSLIARNLMLPSNYLALARASRVYEEPVVAVGRYLVGFGHYPCSVQLRTPTGPQLVTLFNSHDAVTLHEIFCRDDYRCPSPPQVVVDLGSNIGISALYFLTRSPSTYCELYEPDPRNISKLLSNLDRFKDRFTLHELAVADTEGVLPFAREPSGRYGNLDVRHSGNSKLPEEFFEAERISVRVQHINTVLKEAISRHGIIDLLKVDTEGAELATVRAIDPELRDHVRRIVIEWPKLRVNLDGFTATSSCDTITFSRP